MTFDRMDIVLAIGASLSVALAIAGMRYELPLLTLCSPAAILLSLVVIDKFIP